MVKHEYYTKRKNGGIVHRAYSDKGLKIKSRERGVVVNEAFDRRSDLFHYEETDEKIDILKEDEYEQLQQL